MEKTAEDTMAPWERLSSEAGQDLIIFQPRIDTLRDPRTGKTHRRVVLEMGDWCAIVALTTHREVVLVRQYRPAQNAVTLEVPGGLVEAGEDSEVAARRELEEETGYTSPRWSYLGATSPNTAFLSCRCHFWLAEDCLPSAQPEDGMAVEVLSMENARVAVQKGRLDNLVAIVGLAKIMDLH